MKNNHVSFCIVFSLILSAQAGCSRDNAITASGNIEVREVDLASRLSGRIVRKNGHKGDKVAKGQVLAEIDDRIVNAQYDEAKAAFDQVQDEYKRARQLYASSSISRQRFDQAEAAFNQMKSKLMQAEIMKEEAQVKAPWDGIILDSYIEEGELMSALSPFFTIGDMTSAKLNIYVSLIEMEKIRIGDTAVIKIDAYPGREFTGKIIYISNKAEFTPKNIQTKDERIKEVFKVEISLKNEEGIFKPGMPADAVIEMKNEK